MPAVTAGIANALGLPAEVAAAQDYSRAASVAELVPGATRRPLSEVRRDLSGYAFVVGGNSSKCFTATSSSSGGNGSLIMALASITVDGLRSWSTSPLGMRRRVLFVASCNAS